MYCSAFALVIPLLCCALDDLYGHDLLVCQLGTSYPHVQHILKLLKYFVVLKYAGRCPGGGGIVPYGVGACGVACDGNVGGYA